MNHEATTTLTRAEGRQVFFDNARFRGQRARRTQGVMFSEEFLSPLRGSGETGNPSSPGLTPPG
jgi:hypothetical protein